jgi:hypothetical protein
MSKRTDAAARIEMLTTEMKELVLILSEETTISDQEAYAHIYYLRQELSQVVATLGAGRPYRASEYISRRKPGEKS